MREYEIIMEDKEVEPLFSVLNDTISYINKTYANSFNIFNSFKNKHLKKITREKFKQMFNWVKLDNIILLDFINFIESNDDIFPSDRFTIQHLETEDIIKFNFNLPLVYQESKYAGNMTYITNIDCSYVSLNNRTNTIIVKASYKNIYTTKRIHNNKLTMVDKDIVSTYIFKFLVNLMYICSMYYIDGDYNNIERFFNIINPNETIYNNNEEE